MPKLTIVAQGPIASGKSQLVRHFYNNLPEGYELKQQTAMEGAIGLEVWVLDIRKKRIRRTKPNALPR